MQEREESREERRQQVRIVYDDIAARAVTRNEDVEGAIRQAQAHRGPFLIEFRVDPFVNVYPMVAPGKSVADMIRRPMTNVETIADAQADTGS